MGKLYMVCPCGALAPGEEQWHLPPSPPEIYWTSPEALYQPVTKYESFSLSRFNLFFFYFLKKKNDQNVKEHKWEFWTLET